MIGALGVGGRKYLDPKHHAAWIWSRRLTGKECGIAKAYNTERVGRGAPNIGEHECAALGELR